MSLGLDSFEEARQAELPERESDQYEAVSSEGYVVTPLLESDGEGTLQRDGKTLYVHFRYKWRWNFVSYSSDCWAWVTDAKKGGQLVQVDRLEAHLVHKECYGDHSVAVNNASKAHAYFRYNGIAACKASISAWACAENAGYGRWCAYKRAA